MVKDRPYQKSVYRLLPSITHPILLNVFKLFFWKTVSKKGGMVFVMQDPSSAPPSLGGSNS